MKKILQTFLILSLCVTDAFAQGTITYDTPKPHNRWFFGLNGTDVSKLQFGFADPALTNNLLMMKVKHVRYFGGTDSQFHNWLTGYPLTKQETINGYITPNEYNQAFGNAANTLSLFKNSISSQGAEMIFNLNLLTSKFNHQRAGVMNALALGQRIKAIELGNEFYNDGLNTNREFAYAFPTVEVYADSVIGWCKTLDDLFLTTPYPPKVIAIGSDLTNDNANNKGDAIRINTWLPRLIAKIPWGQTFSPDGITIHRYTGAGYFDFANEKKLVLDNNEADMAKFLNTPRRNFEKFNATGAELSQIGAVGTKAYITEYGLFDNEREVHGTWGHGLFVALQTLTYLESDVVELADFHTMIGTSLFSSIFSTTQGLNLSSSFNDNWQETGLNGDDYETINNVDEEVENGVPLDPIDYATEIGQRTAVGNALQLVGQALDDASQKEKLIFTGILPVGVTYPNQDEVFYDKLYGWRMKGISGNYKYIIINNSINDVAVTLPSGSTGSYTTLAANPREYIVGNAIAPPLIYPTINLDNFNEDITTPIDHVPYKFVGNTTEGASFTFKPYSITYISGAYPGNVILETLGNLCLPGYWTLGNSYTIKTPNGVGPYTFTSDVAINANGNTLNVVNSPNDYVTLPAYRPAGLAATSDYTITFTVKDMGKGGATASLIVKVKAKKTVQINLEGTTTDAGLVINACDAGCINLTAGSFDTATPTNNRYEWYTVDGNKTFNSIQNGTYGDNGYSQSVRICPQQAQQKYYVIAYSGYNVNGKDCDFAIDEITINTPIAKANPEINDATNLYVCNTFPGNEINLGNPAQLGATYQWTAVGSTTGTTISSTTVAQPMLTITSPSVTSVTYSVKVSLTSTCFNTSQITTTPKKCCTTASDDLKFKPYSTMTEVIDAIQANANCTTCVDVDEKIVTNFDGTINFNGPIVHGIGDKNTITFKDCDNLQFSQEAYLSVRDGNLFILDNSKADACTIFLWRGLQAKTAMEGIKVLNNSSVKNSLYGIYGLNNASITAKNSLFDKNYYHMYFKGYGGNFDGVSNQTGITGNIFTHSSGVLYQPYITNDRTVTSIKFDNCPGSLLIGGDPLAYNTITNTNLGINSYQSGLVAKNNTITNFRYGIYSSDSRQYLNYVVQDNSISSNYYFTGTQSTVELGNYGTAIYIAANANITPDTISISGNTITNSRQGIFMSKLNGKPLTVDLDGPYGGEIKQNTITLYKDPDAADDFTHKAMVLLDNNNIDVVKNTLKTDPTTFGLLSPQSKIDKYWGLEAKNQGGGSDYFDNEFTQLGQMFRFSGNNEFAQLKCNQFKRGTTVNYPGDGANLGITAIQLVDDVDMSTQGTAANTANNTWQNFGSAYFRARWLNRGTTPFVLYNYYAFDGSHNPNSPDVFQAFEQDPDVICNDFPGMVVNQNDGNHHQNNDFAKDGGDDIDSLTIVNYEPTYDSTAVINDLYGDVNELQMTFDAIAAGLVDSATVIEIYAESAALGIYNLEQAISNGDSATIITSLLYLPKDIVGDNYKITALVNAKTTEWTALDTLDLEYVAYQRVDEGGPAVVTARNMLGIYVDETTIAPKSNQRRTNATSGIILNLVPNPNNGSFILNTNLPETSKILIHNALGQLVYEGKVAGTSTSINTDRLYNGIYSLSVIDLNGKSKTTTFVVNK